MRNNAAATALALSILTPAAQADGYIIGAGRWTCEKAIEVLESGTESEKGQLAGWIFGFWSFATGTREAEFVDKVEAAGGIRIADLTIAECRKAPPETMVYQVSGSIIRNTK